MDEVLQGVVATVKAQEKEVTNHFLNLELLSFVVNKNLLRKNQNRMKIDSCGLLCVFYGL